MLTHSPGGGMRDGSPRPCPAPGSPPGGTEPRPPPETSTPPCASETGGPPPGASKRQRPEGTWVWGAAQVLHIRQDVLGPWRKPALPGDGRGQGAGASPAPCSPSPGGHWRRPSQVPRGFPDVSAPEGGGSPRRGWGPATGAGSEAQRPGRCGDTPAQVRLTGLMGRRPPRRPRGGSPPTVTAGPSRRTRGLPPGKLRLCGAEVRSPRSGSPRCQRQGQEPPSPGNRPGSWGGRGGTTGALLSHLQAGDRVMPGGGGSGSSCPTADVEGHPPSPPTRPGPRPPSSAASRAHAGTLAPAQPSRCPHPGDTEPSSPSPPPRPPSPASCSRPRTLTRSHTYTTCIHAHTTLTHTGSHPHPHPHTQSRTLTP